MAGDGGSAFPTNAIEDIHHAWGKASFLDQGCKVQDTERGLLGGFDDDRVPASQRGADLPRSHCERVVPRDDLPTDAQRLPDRVRKFRRRGVDDLAVELVRIASIIAETGADFSHVFIQRHLIRLAVVPGFDCGEDLGVGVRKVGEFMEESSAVTGRQVTPRGRSKSGSGGGDCIVDICR